jgi:hypothetical protein
MNIRNRDYEALRGRILLVFQGEVTVVRGADGTEFLTLPAKLSIAAIARELNVTRQAVYRALPEFSGGRL